MLNACFEGDIVTLSMSSAQSHCCCGYFYNISITVLQLGPNSIHAFWKSAKDYEIAHQNHSRGELELVSGGHVLGETAAFAGLPHFKRCGEVSTLE